MAKSIEAPDFKLTDEERMALKYRPQLGDVVHYQISTGELRMAHVLYVHSSETVNLMVFPAFVNEDFKLLENVNRGGSVGQWIYKPVDMRL